MSNKPATSIHYRYVEVLVKALGFDPNDVYDIFINPSEVSVSYYVRDEKTGDIKFADTPKGFAAPVTGTRTIPIVRDA